MDGGWGVDALLERQSRAHSDLDLVVPAEQFVAACAALRAEAFEFAREQLPASVVFHHPDGREVDIHPAERTADGGGDQYRPDGTGMWHYGPPARGRIDGRWVTCLSLKTQLRAHVGYEPDANDFADMRLLRDELRCELPPPFDRS